MKVISARIAILLNITALVLLLYFVLTNFYSWQTFSVWLNKDEYGYDVRPDFKWIVAATIFLPVIIVLLRKKYAWLIQTLLISMSVNFYKTDIFQKTLLINQPTSTYRICQESEALIKTAESDVQQLAATLILRLPPDSVSPAEMPTYTGQKTFEINFVEIERGKLIRIIIKPTIPPKSRFNYTAEYYPNGWESIHGLGDIPQLGTHLFNSGGGIYSYGKHWWVIINGPARG